MSVCFPRVLSHGIEMGTLRNVMQFWYSIPNSDYHYSFVLISIESTLCLVAHANIWPVKITNMQASQNDAPTSLPNDQDQAISAIPSATRTIRCERRDISKLRRPSQFGIRSTLVPFPRRSKRSLYQNTQLLKNIPPSPPCPVMDCQRLDWGGVIASYQKKMGQRRKRRRSLASVDIDACMEIQQFCDARFHNILEEHCDMEKPSFERPSLQSSDSDDAALPTLKELAGLVLNMSLTLNLHN